MPGFIAGFASAAPGIGGGGVIVPALAGAVAGADLSNNISGDVLRAAFAVFLLIASVKLVVKR